VNQKQKVVLIIGCCLFVLASIVFVPWQETWQNKNFGPVGYAPIFAPPERDFRAMEVDGTRMALQLLAVAVTTGVFFTLVKD